MIQLVMRPLALLIFFGCAVFSLRADTTTVQTYTYEAQNNPETAYDSPGRRWFSFPPSDNGAVYGKVLMEYSLKCFEDGTAGNLGYACGEWDYLSYTYLFDHTGLLDSAALQHPLRLLADAPFDTTNIVPYVEGVQDSVWLPAAQYIVDMVLSETVVQPGSVVYTAPLFEPTTGKRAQFLWTAEELAPLQAGSIDRLFLPVQGAPAARRMDLKWGLTTDSALTGFKDLPHTAYQYGLSPWQFGDSLSIRLSPPIEWDGESNLVLEFAMDDVTSQTDGNEDGWVPVTGMAGGAWTTGGHDGEVDFTAPDRVEVDVADLEGLSSEITIECWVYGDPASQPENGTLLEGVNASGQRVVNVHLPWSNGRVYWDCGFDGGYDRIDQQAQTEDYEGRWNHWAFVKNADTGIMEMYLNGALFHSGSGKDNPIEGIVKMNLGASANGNNRYNGRVDDFRVWSQALDGETIASWMNRQPTAWHPQYDALLVDYRFDGANGTEEENHSPNGGPGFHHGSTLRRATPAREQAKGLGGDFRPYIGFGRGEYLELVADGSILDLQPVAPMSLSTWEVQGNGVAMTDLTYHYAPGETVGVPLFGDTVTYPVPGEVTEVINDTLDYFGVPFDVIDRYELYRYITPYGIGLDLGDDGWTWWYDVTDYLPLLRDSVELQAGNWQELLDLKFHFIEGEPARDVLDVEAFWKGQYGLSTFDQNVVGYEYEPAAGEEMWRLKTRASGHGFGSGNNCAEFCYNIHKVKVDGEELWSWQIMRECGDNALFPQGGTWIYDRAGWCPGAPVDTRDMELTPHVAGDGPFTVDYDVDYDPDGNYRFEGQVIAYGPANHSLDAELVEVLAPSGTKLASRTNPICDRPKVVLRNSGSTPLTSCTITFGLPDNLQSYTWTGELSFLEEEVVELVALDASMWDGDDEEDLAFVARVSAPNGGTDEVAWNDEVHSTFRRPPTYTYLEDPGDEDDNRLIIFIRTNSTPWENSAKLTHQDGTVYFERSYPEANTQYRDTIYLNQGCYTFEFQDSDDDGISFWANDDGSGFVRLRKVGGNWVTFEPDFGKSIVHRFHFETNLVNSVAPSPEVSSSFKVFPNPTSQDISFTLEGWQGRFDWQLQDAAGRVVQSGSGLAYEDAAVQGRIPVQEVPPGVHMLTIIQPGRLVRERVVIF